MGERPREKSPLGSPPPWPIHMCDLPRPLTQYVNESWGKDPGERVLSVVHPHDSFACVTCLVHWLSMRMSNRGKTKGEEPSRFSTPMTHSHVWLASSTDANSSICTPKSHARICIRTCPWIATWFVGRHDIVKTWWHGLDDIANNVCDGIANYGRDCIVTNGRHDIVINARDNIVTNGRHDIVTIVCHDIVIIVRHDIVNQMYMMTLSSMDAMTL